MLRIGTDFGLLHPIEDPRRRRRRRKKKKKKREEAECFA